MSDIKLKHLLTLGFGLLVVAMAAALYLAQSQLHRLQGAADDFSSSQSVQVAQLVQASRAQEAAGQLARQLAGLLAGGETAQLRAAQPQVDAALDGVTGRLNTLSAHVSNEGKPLLDAARGGDSLLRNQVASYRQLLAANHGDEARGYLQATLWPTALKYQDAVSQYARFESELSLKMAPAAGAGAADQAANEIIGMGGAVAALAIVLAWLLTRAAERQIGGDPQVLAAVLRELASGEVRTEFRVRKGDQSSPFAFLHDVVARTLENLRLRSALDVCTTNVMIADAEHQVVYANRAVLDMFQQAEADIRQDLPQFSARGILGSNIDSFHRNPAYQRGVLQQLRNTHRGTIKVGGRTFSLVLTPILDGQNRKLGSVVEWVDATRELERKAAEDGRQAVDRQAAAENARIRSALDVCTTNVMIADENHQIIYANQSVLNMFRNAEADIRKDIPRFSASSLLGANIDQFHKNPSYQRGLLLQVKETHRSSIVVGGRTFGLILSPIFNDKGERLGAVVEWQDNTEMLRLQHEAQLRTDKEREQAAENARIRSALDVCTTNVMIADEQHRIIYANQSVLDMFRNAEADIRKDIPRFSTGNLMGTKIDEFHKNPSYQHGMLQQVRETHRSSIMVGGRTFGLILSPIFNDKGERLGAVVEWQDNTEMLRLQAEADVRAAEERKVAAENGRIRSALDNCTTNVMIADNDRKIIYMNHSVTDMLRGVEGDLRKALPNFDVRALMGSTIDEFHKNPAHQRDLLANMRSTYRTEIVVAGRTFSLVANPVFGADGTRLGSVVEWKDRTAEVEIEREVAEIVSAASAGEFGKRIEVEGKQGFFKLLSEGMNQLMGVTSQGLSDIATVLGALARGDLTRTIAADYQGLFGQLKTDSNATVDKLKEIVTNIKDSTDAINTAAKEIAAGNSNLSGRTEQQAASLEETASSMEEITSTVRQNAENAKKANSLATGASDIAARGGKVVGDVVSTMNEINESAKKIVDIISVIDGIAFQTNILALNAAVEAARAGEQGRGFAVVASEVRNLAQRSAAAAKEIKSLIGNSVDKVESGSRLVDEAGRTMNEIVVSIRRVADIMSDISAASAEQSSGIEQVNLAVTQMDENTQKNAALVEQAAAAAESLEEQARYLSDAVAVFKLDERLSHGRPPAGKPSVQHGFTSGSTSHLSNQHSTHQLASAAAGKSASHAGSYHVKSRSPEPIRPQGDSGEGSWEEF
ncbi:methyl-accepting chemotaxis protein [Chromobacterium sphagni]|uniref:methyl-accepting chemotaxis protein n=1 Tax=Chromobacterium sphagni TaxID=1903179 RepID=UPI000AA7B6E7|nr:methyl-accepting chemotaxis protein [Chromobacterium sphagni]